MTYDRAQVTEALERFIEREQIRPGTDYIVWQSAVYALMDCVYSAQARYHSTVLPILRERLPMRLEDRAELTFKDLLADVASLSENSFERYASEVLKNRQKLAGRLKIEVVCDAARLFQRAGLETSGDFIVLSHEALEHLILRRLPAEVRGIGPTLARYFLLLLGREDQVKPDTLLLRLFARETGWTPRMGHEQDMNGVQNVLTDIAPRMNTTPARLDNALWLYESTRSI